MPLPSPTTPLTAPERKARYRLARTENVGPVTFARLLDRFGSAEAALDAIPALAKNGGRQRPLIVPTTAKIDDEIARLERMGASWIVRGDAAYPDTLDAMDDAPPLVTYKGHINLLARRAVAIVGSRHATINGRKFAETLARELASSDLAIVSGLARGIDGAAHVGALAAKAGTGTIAAVAGGVDVVYPPEHAELHARIAEEGLVIAENPPGQPPLARDFPRRNRLIAGLALGTLVVEAALSSGSLITARLALDYGRELFAAPGAPYEPRAAGSNQLLKDGAQLVTSASDIISTLSQQRAVVQSPRGGFTAPPASEGDLAPVRRAVDDALGYEATGVDDLIRTLGLPAGAVHTVLLEMELAGRLHRHHGQKVARVLDDAPTEHTADAYAAEAAKGFVRGS